MAIQTSLFEEPVSKNSPEHQRRLREQQRLLAKARGAESSLSEVLEEAGWSYDDLVYERAYSPLTRRKAPYVSLDDVAVKESDIPIASFFTGAGGIDLGFEAAGFKPVLAAEHNALFVETLRANHPTLTVLGPPTHSGDVSDFEAMESGVTAAIGRKRGFSGVFVGGPPCQPFSIAANQRFSKAGENFKRVGFAHEKNGNLLFDYLQLVERFRPKAVLIENVPGLGDIDGGEQLARAVRLLESWGYHVHKPTVLNAADFDVPQYRRRLFVIAFANSNAAKRFRLPVPNTRHLTVDGALLGVTRKSASHETREHSAESVSRYMRLDIGDRDALGRVDRLNPYVPSKTIIAGGTKGGGRSHLHPHHPRTLSVRECARLQTFPDSYQFLGAVARQFTQVGNAVPPVLAFRIAEAMRSALEGRA